MSDFTLTPVYGVEIPPRAGGRKGSSKYAPFVELFVNQTEPTVGYDIPEGITKESMAQGFKHVLKNMELEDKIIVKVRPTRIYLERKKERVA